MRRFVGILFAWGLLLVVGAAAQEPTPLPSQDGLGRLNENLERIAAALESMQADQQVLLTLQRLSLAERRLTPLHEEARRARDEVRAREEQIAQLASFQTQLERQVQEATRSGADPLALPEREELEQLRAMLELEQDRLAEAQRRVVEAEDDLERSRRRVEILDERLEELLGGLGE